MRIALIDYGAGNLRSAARALAAAGGSPEIVTGPSGLGEIDAIVVPGVGAFAQAMRRLHAAGLVEPIRDAARHRLPLVGICLGMQLLFESSEEGEPVQGLGLLRGTVRRLPECVRVPHVGWNTFEPCVPDPLFTGLPATYVYFVHSYVAHPIDPSVVLSETYYGTRFPAIVRHDRIWGLQFHPEKSSRAGAALLANLLARMATPQASA